MKYLLDTNVVSEFRKPEHKQNPNVLAWVRATGTHSFWISAVTVQELYLGVIRMEHRDERQALSLRQWIEEVVEDATLLTLDKALLDLRPDCAETIAL
ncbi:MAG: hypothetical protein SPK50_07740 [Mobiluncus porci]|uniref:Type II toxin-antitoxin system VapC family toxin n=1 Tax=Mobiluncus porci TaxID=2652278 RepID=A0A7K0K086_9ACTO|nr:MULTISPECIES: PIN domain-containing protein [Mobiluncus]MCI6585003.1 hypothetical protein [Mobiluncus sp.]MDD7542143.1 hypothetical protein [Mobiluncus porci]MDY5749002.1 hypothetical protein [Mobiluncus porci]MST48883.1 type II toxin-antitoxin system VapC family toxin [Mobiluncus porci]